MCQTLSISSITADGAIIVCHHKRRASPAIDCGGIPHVVGEEGTDCLVNNEARAPSLGTPEPLK